ncbi:hypothetical protein KCV05_g96, partial [Aureobasidium melanogenum]
MSSFDRVEYVQIVTGSCVDELRDDRGSYRTWVGIVLSRIKLFRGSSGIEASERGNAFTRFCLSVSNSEYLRSVKSAWYAGKGKHVSNKPFAKGNTATFERFDGPLTTTSMPCPGVGVAESVRSSRPPLNRGGGGTGGQRLVLCGIELANPVLWRGSVVHGVKRGGFWTGDRLDSRKRLLVEPLGQLARQEDVQMAREVGEAEPREKDLA